MCQNSRDSKRERQDGEFDEIFKDYRQRIHRLVCKVVGNRDWAEDITAEVFIEAWLSIGALRDRSKLERWLYRLAVNVCHEHIRRTSAKRRVLEVPFSPDQIEEIGARATQLEDAIDTAQMAERILAQLRGLNYHDQRALMLHLWAGMSCRQIAGRLGVSTGAVKARLFRAKRAIRQQLTCQHAPRAECGTASKCPKQAVDMAVQSDNGT
jgi:RNA polymerase sigma-70 factor (ECF subfamily)